MIDGLLIDLLSCGKQIYALHMVIGLLAVHGDLDTKLQS